MFLGILIGVVGFLVFRFVTPSVLGKRSERIGIAGRYSVNSLPNYVLKLVGVGLTRIDEKGIVEPGLAESWETTDGGKTWTFHLKDDIFWQDGKRITSGEIEYGFSDAEVEKVDEKTITFKLADAYSPFPVVVSRPIFKKGLLSTGEWEVTKASIAGDILQSLTLVNKEKQKKIIKFYPTEERAKLAFKLGAIDILEGVIDEAPFDSWRTAEAKSINEYSQVVSIFFNTQDSLVAEKSVRQALNYAINKKEFGGVRAISPLSPKSWAFNSQVKAYEYDPKRVKELLSEVEEAVEIKLLTSPLLLPIAEIIVEDWKDAGFSASLQVSSVIPEDYQAYLAILDIPKDPDQYSIWHSTQTGTNISNYQNPRIDKLLEDGRTLLSFEDRKKTYLDFQRFLVEDLPAIFLFHPEYFRVVRK